MSKRGSFKAWTWGGSVNSPASPFSSTERHVALTLEKFMSVQGDSCWPSMDTLAAHSGRAISTVRDAIGRLTEWGWLEREIRVGRGRSNRYLAVIPEYFDQQLEADENRRRAVGFSEVRGQAAPALAPQTPAGKPTGERRVSEGGSEGETRRSPAAKPPERLVKPTGVRHQLDQDQSKDLSTSTPSELDEGREVELRLAISAALSAQPETPQERRRWDTAVATLVAIGAAGQEVTERCVAWPFSAPITPEALVRHWGFLGGIVATAAPNAEASIESWLARDGWRLTPEDARVLLEDAGLTPARIEQVLEEAATIRAERGAGAAATERALTERKVDAA